MSSKWQQKQGLLAAGWQKARLSRGVRWFVDLRFYATTINDAMRFIFDPDKVAANFQKHVISLADAPLVFNAPGKITLESAKTQEPRLMDIAFVD